jgi:DNA repair exonuclease SbcCD ATPase subunit
MRLIACRLRNIRRHQDLQVAFGRRLTLITGANETGKSTLVEALHKGLFLRATATGRGVEELRSRLHAGLPELEIQFETADASWRLRKRFAGSSGTCQLSNGQGVALSGAAAEEQLAALLGFEAPVEGRRIAQLPERWAHLWVRQGDAGLNPIGGNQESYDHNRLIEQLQQSGGSRDALESALDRQVLDTLQAQLGELYTATGRIKAGGPLADAVQRSAKAAEALSQAQQQLADLEAAMEQWQRISERLETIESQQLPLLQRELALSQQIQLLEAQLEPLQLQAREQRQLQEQQQRDSLEQQREQGQLEVLLTQQQQQLNERQQRQQQLSSTQQQLQSTNRELDTLQQQLDLQQLSAELQQLRQHERELERLQAEAAAIKQQLAGLPEITGEQVKQLRHAEQQLAQASARCEAMAASLEVLSSDQSIQLNGAPITAGERRLIQAATQLQIGAGVVLQLNPGGGDALPQALERRSQGQRELKRLQQQLQLDSSEAAEAIERQRQALSAELENLRKAARAIPWSGLQQRLAELQPRRQQLQEALATAGAQPHSERSGLEARQQELRRSSTELTRQQEQLNRALQELEQALQQNQGQVEAGRMRLAQREGSLQVIAQRLQSLGEQQGDGEVLLQQQAQLTELLQERQRLQGERRSEVALEIEALEQEKDQLLSQRGQMEQRCSSLGAINPTAELEQRQAVWEDAEAHRLNLEQRAKALQLLQERFDAVRSDQASRYSEPLRLAIHPYLADAQQQPLVGFDPQRGFHDLQLNQSGEAFAFERLSGGMREQLAAAVRLAMAEVLKPAYGDVLPLVFDDAFTNSDRERLVGLKRMLQRGLDQGIQIIVLSCHPEDYSDLIEPDTKNPPARGEGIDAVRVSLSQR